MPSKVQIDQSDYRAALASMDVSRETLQDLTAYAELLQRWQMSKNLIAPDTLPHLWTRHIADSFQLLRYMQDGSRIVDIGSGAGLPGVVLAIGRKFSAGSHVDLVESRSGKAAFLREAVRRSSAPAAVHCMRIEDFTDTFQGRADYVTARALAPLSQLLAYSFPLLTTGAKGLFLKGQDVLTELTEAQKYWTFSHRLWPSVTDPKASILEVSEVAPKA